MVDKERSLVAKYMRLPLESKRLVVAEAATQWMSAYGFWPYDEDGQRGFGRSWRKLDLGTV